MPNTTQQAIMDSFVDLLGERSMDKITVIDITKRCGVNRNTFYYHFHDIYELLDQILLIEKNRLIKLASSDFSTWRESFREGVSWCLAKKDAVYNVYNSSSRDRIVDYIVMASRTSASRYVETQLEGLDVAQRHIDTVKNILSSTLAGYALSWLADGMKSDLRADVLRAADLSQGTIRSMLDFRYDLCNAVPLDDVEPASEEELAAALNAEGTEIKWSNPDDGQNWPMVPGESEGKISVVSTNAGVDESISGLVGTFTAGEGDAVVFDFMTSTETAMDLFTISLDGEIIKFFSGEHDWMTYAVPVEEAGGHEIVLSYLKDYYEAAGSDEVRIGNVRILSGGEAAEAMSANPGLQL